MAAYDDRRSVSHHTVLDFVAKTFANHRRALSDSGLTVGEENGEDSRKWGGGSFSNASTDVFVEGLDPSTTECGEGSDIVLSGTSHHLVGQATESHVSEMPCQRVPWMIPVQAVPTAWVCIPCSQSYLQQTSWTTVMLKNIPNDYTQELFLKLLDDQGFLCRYDFVYLPIDFRSGSAFGYAFVNLVSPQDALRFKSHFHGFCRWTFSSRKVAEVTWSHPMQGRDAAIARYRNCSVMNQDVPERFKPCMFDSGVRTYFPPPTRSVDVPQSLRPRVKASHSGRSSRFTAKVWRADRVSSKYSDRTTLMLRNLPNDYDRSMLLSLFDKEGFKGQYDFVYLPLDFASAANLGYAFINMVSHQDAERFRVYFTGFVCWAMPSRKVAEVTWSNPHQGLGVHVARYRNSTVMHQSVHDKFKPAIFANGVRVPFPPPTRIILAPRSYTAREGSKGCA